MLKTYPKIIYTILIKLIIQTKLINLISLNQLAFNFLGDLLISKAEKGVRVLILVNEDDVEKESLNSLFASKVREHFKQLIYNFIANGS